MSIGEQIIQGIIDSLFVVLEFTVTQVIGSIITALFNLFGITM